MRSQFYEQLDLIVTELVGVTGDVRQAVAEATEALLSVDRNRAEGVISSEAGIEGRLVEIEERSLMLMATQQPVATDLRQLVASLRMIDDLQRMSHHAVHIAEAARRRMPAAAIPEAARATIMEMASLADVMIGATAQIVAERDLERARRFDGKDDDMDALHQGLFRLLLNGQTDFGVEEAVDLALLSGCFERIADHAVNMAHRVVYLVTGQRLET